MTGTTESLAGRIHTIRDNGKLKFYDLHSEGTKVQILAQMQFVSMYEIN